MISQATTATDPAADRLRPAPRPGRGPSAPEPPARRELPPEAPLDMPIQSLSLPATGTAPAGGRRERGYRAMALIGASLTLTALAVLALFDVLAADTIGPLDALILAVFAPLFAWTAFSFASAAAGLWATARGYDSLGIDPRGPLPALAGRTAILAPVYNESPRPLCARLEAIWRSIEATGAGAHFDLFVLSDTTRADIQTGEIEEVRTLRRRLGSRARLFYRHRPLNVDRKAGNLADWVRRFGGAYDHMVVLDADSLMEGETLVRLSAAMERRPALGLIQTTPVVINRHSLFGRAEQFASRLYGPLLARGLDWWSGGHGNYWGHNAIVRVAAFAACAGLPHLPGRRPFGGHILSHDFVEAALIARAGWEVRMAPTLGGSYEESPPSLADMITRDRRWCQGNLQHLRVLTGSGLHWISRWHLFRGVAAYLTAPLWLALLVMGALLPLRPDWGVSSPEAANALAAGATPPLISVAGVYAISMAFLVAPKLMAFGAMLASPRERRAFGRVDRAFWGLGLEILLSALMAPVLMLNQIWALISILAGRDAGWQAQAREEGMMSLEAAADQHLGDTSVGAILGVAAWGASPSTFLWMLPVIVGMLGCIPMATLTASRAIGEAARRAGLLVIPEEAAPPRVVRTFNRLMSAPPERAIQPAGMSAALA